MNLIDFIITLKGIKDKIGFANVTSDLATTTDDDSLIGFQHSRKVVGQREG